MACDPPSVPHALCAALVAALVSPRRRSGQDAAASPRRRRSSRSRSRPRPGRRTGTDSPRSLGSPTRAGPQSARPARGRGLWREPTDPGDDDPARSVLRRPPRAAAPRTLRPLGRVVLADAPPDSDGNLLTVPPYVETMKATFEQAYQVENGTSEWRRTRSPTRVAEATTGRRLRPGHRRARASSATPARTPSRAAAASTLPGDGRRLRRSSATRFHWPRFQVTAATSTTTCSSTPTTPAGHLDVRSHRDLVGGEGVRRGQRLPAATSTTWADLPRAADLPPVRPCPHDDLKMYGSAISEPLARAALRAQEWFRRAWAGSQADSVVAGLRAGRVRPPRSASLWHRLRLRARRLLLRRRRVGFTPDSGDPGGVDVPDGGRRPPRFAASLDGAAATSAYRHTASSSTTYRSRPAGELSLTGGLPTGGAPGSIALRRAPGGRHPAEASASSTPTASSPSSLATRAVRPHHGRRRRTPASRTPASSPRTAIGPGATEGNLP